MKVSQSLVYEGQDHTPVESFLSSPNMNWCGIRQFQNQVEDRYAIAEYIERFSNSQRSHQALGYRSS